MRKFLAKVMGYSDAQLTRLIAQQRRTGHIRDHRLRPPSRPFATVYTTADALLLAEVDEAFGQLDDPLLVLGRIPPSSASRHDTLLGWHQWKGVRHSGATPTRQIAAPILDANGEPIRRKGGKIVRSTTDMDANPLARFVKALTDTSLPG